MAENEVQKSKRDVLSERLRTKYPEREYADDEALFAQVNDDYDDYEKRLGDYRSQEEQMEEMFARDPKNAQFFADMAAGKDPWIAVVERLGIDGVTELLNDPEKKEDYDKANSSYAERLAKEKDLEAEYDNNISETLKLREQWDAQYGVETVDAALMVVDQMTKDAIMGKVTPETLEMALKVVRHDADMENARSEGEIAGRNAKIEDKIRHPQTGDGLPAMGGSSAGTAPKRKLNIFDYADAAK